MLQYLKTSYPNAYVYKTKFGNLIYNMDKERHFEMMTYSNLSLNRNKVVEQLQNLFCCSDYLADTVYHNWWYSIPMYERMDSTTNTEVLVPVKRGCVQLFLNKY